MTTSRSRALSVRAEAATAFVGLACLAALGFGAASPAVAALPDVTGQKYGDASGTLNTAGFEPVVATTVGDRNAWADCIVTFAHQHNVPPPPNSRGAVRHQVLVSLNCDASVASATRPGPSAASTEGRAAKAAAAKG